MTYMYCIVLQVILSYVMLYVLITIGRELRQQRTRNVVRHVKRCDQLMQEDRFFTILSKELIWNHQSPLTYVGFIFGGISCRFKHSDDAIYRQDRNWHAISIVSCRVVSCPVTWRHAAPHHVAPRHVTSHHVSFHVIHHVSYITYNITYHILDHRIYHILSCHILSCHVISFHIIYQII